MSHNIPYAKSNPEKMKVIQQYAKGDPCNMMNYLTYIRLPLPTLKTICEMRGNDWLCYGAMKEYEVGDNRDEADVPEANKNDDDWSEVLSEELFNKVKKGNPSKTLTYDLYLLMRGEEGY